MKSRIPKPAIRLTTGSTTIYYLTSGGTSIEQDYPWAKRMIGRFPLPSFQRESIWSTAQDKSFIESVFTATILGPSLLTDLWIQIQIQDT